MSNIDIDEKESKLVIERFTELKNERSKYITRWKDIENYVSITNEVNVEFENHKQPNQQKDVYINSPTAFTSVWQAGDYLAGILWSENAITLEPSDYIKKKTQGKDFSDFYKNATAKTLEQINATDAGFSAILKSYAYDQFSYGTSGIGTFKSKEFEKEQSECCLNFKAYGVHNCCIDEGSNNKIDVVYTVYNWRLNQIIEEFCYTNDKLDEEKIALLPDEIKKSYEANKWNDKFKLVYGIMPNNYYSMGKRGKVGARYKGYWFLDGTNKVFKVDFFKKLPIAICRAIRVNGQVYGESSGSLAISSIKMLNHISGRTVDNIEMQNEPPLGALSGALVNGNVIDRGSGAVNLLNPKAGANGQTPIFPISQIGDISAIVNFLIPELKKDIVNIFKIDQLLDFNNQTAMTATESSFRMSIRGKSINGTLTQQKIECIEPTCHRAISIIQDCGLYGQILEDLPEDTPEEIKYKQQVQQSGDFVPEEIAEAMKNGKIWYKLKFNGELEKLCNAELYEAIGRFLQYLQIALQIKPSLIEAINDYDLLTLLKSASNLVNEGIVKSKYKYNEIIKQIEEAQVEQAKQMQMLQGSQVAKNLASAGKDEAIANEK